jgi:hypothetical protein
VNVQNEESLEIRLRADPGILDADAGERQPLLPIAIDDVPGYRPLLRVEHRDRQGGKKNERREACASERMRGRAEDVHDMVAA